MNSAKTTIATAGYVAYDGEFYYVAKQNGNTDLSFTQTMVLVGIDNYNKKNQGVYKAFRFKTRSAAEKKLNSFLNK